MTAHVARHRCAKLLPQPAGRPNDLIDVCGRIATHRQTYTAVSGWAVETFRCDEHAIATDAKDHLTTNTQPAGFEVAA